MDRSKRNFLRVLTLAGVSSATYGLIKVRPNRKPSSSDDWASIRERFSLSQERTYFNNGTLGPSPDAVLIATMEVMKQVERTGDHHETESIRLREKFAAFVGASSEEISLTHNTTESINIIAQGLPLQRGDEVIITTHEHVGNALPWLNRARLDGIVLKSFEPARTASVVLAQVEALITSRTRVIAIPYISCTTGQVFPVQRLAKLAHRRKIWIAVDGAHAVGMIPLRLRELDVDFFGTCGHKWLCGPKGTGFLYIKKELLDTVEAKFVGAYSDTGWSLTPPKITGLAPTAHRYDYGSQNTALYAGASAAIDFFNQIGMDKISQYGFGLSQTLSDELLKRSNDIELLTPTEPTSRGMITSFRFKRTNKSYVEFASYASKQGFRVRQVPEAGLNAIRISTHLYNSKDEVFAFLKVLEQFLSNQN